MVPLSFAGQEFALTRSGALYWAAKETLLVADLHLEKGSFFARRGQLIPPYDSRETLNRVAAAIRETGARRVVTLGDNFHDDEGSARLEPHACGMLEALTNAVEWLWITGNHDAGMKAQCGGKLHEEIDLAGVALRHIARPGENGNEISGHFHPKLQVAVHHRRVRRACAVISANDEVGDGQANRMIMPAFGAFTGGMDAAHPAILKALQPASSIEAVLPAGHRLVRFPLWQKAA